MHVFLCMIKSFFVHCTHTDTSVHAFLSSAFQFKIIPKTKVKGLDSNFYHYIFALLYCRQ